MHTLFAFLAALLLAPAVAAAPAQLIDPAGFVQVAAKKDEEGAKAAAKKPSSSKKAAKNEAVKKAEKKTEKKGGKKNEKKAGKDTEGKSAAKKPGGKNAKAEAGDAKAGRRLADFGKTKAPADVMHVANWAAWTRNHGKYAFVIIDKKNARLYVFDNKARLRRSAPILLGKAIGDHTAPGVGSKRLSELAEDEKTTPAGRFPARPGVNNHGEDVIWIDYDSGVSMHRMRPVDPKERRAHRMATATHEDNRISNGCVNVPHKFYNSVLKPVVDKYGAWVYVLPETKTPQQMFASFDVPTKDHDEVKVAKAKGKE